MVTAATAAELATVNESWGAFMKAGNAEGLAGLYTEDCKVLPPGVPAVTGRKAFQKYVEGVVAGGCTGAKLASVEIEPGADDTKEGGTFWEIGRYTFFKNGDDIMDTGKYVAVWKKISGKIEVLIDCWNSNGQ